ncbi:MAG: type II secretory pathway predicted ATPase ExeA, partial [Enterobacterales bacterium]
MNDKKDEQLVDRLDPTLLNESISNDQFFDAPAEFEAKHNQNIIDKLIHLSRFGNLLTLVVGNNGCGKTYLLDKLISSVDDSCQICHINAQPLLSIEQLFQEVTESFAGETTFTGIPLTANQYEEWAEQLSTIPGNRLLIIDDAEVLSTSVLHELCQLSAMQQEKETPHLHVILFGNYDLNSLLEQASHNVLNEEGIYAIDIPSLNGDGAKEWLEYLFKRDGVIFLPEAEELDKMLLKGQGNLTLLEVEAGEYSAISHEFDEFENEPETWKVSGIGYWFGGLTILIMLVLGLFFFQKELTALFGIADDQAPVMVKNESILDTTTEEVISEISPDEVVTSETENAQTVEQILDETTSSYLDDQVNDQVDDLEARKEESTANETVVEKINDSNNNDDTIDNLVEDAAEIS